MKRMLPCFIVLTGFVCPQVYGAESVLLGILGEELAYAREHLATEDGTKPYYIGLTISDRKTVTIAAELGALMREDDAHRRMLDVDVRVGDHKIDNTHKIRGGGFGFDPSDFRGRAAGISIEDNADSIRHSIWLALDSRFKSAAKKHQRVVTNLKTKVEEEDKSDDFSKEKPSQFSEQDAVLRVDRSAWVDRVRSVSKRALDYPLIYNSNVTFVSSADNRYLVTSEGTKLQTGKKLLRVIVSASTKAEDGMEINQSHIFNTAHEEKLPSESEMKAAFQ